MAHTNNEAMEFQINDWNKVEELIKDFRLLPREYVEDGRKILMNVRKVKKYTNTKHKKYSNVIATVICNPDTGRVDEIDFNKHHCPRYGKMFKVLCLCIDAQWTVDENTEMYYVYSEKKNIERRGKAIEYWSKIKERIDCNKIFSIDENTL